MDEEETGAIKDGAENVLEEVCLGSPFFLQDYDVLWQWMNCRINNLSAPTLVTILQKHGLPVDEQKWDNVVRLHRYCESLWVKVHADVHLHLQVCVYPEVLCYRLAKHNQQDQCLRS